LKSLFHCTIVLAGMAAAAPQAVRADDLPSIIRHTARTGNWTVRKTSPASKGKCKIFLAEPKYDDNHEISDDQLEKELKEKNDSYTFNSGSLGSGGRDYWIVFYPKLGNVKVELEFTRGEDTKMKATLLVDGLLAADMWGKGPKITFTKSSTKAGDKAKYYENKFRKGFTFLARELEPFITLD